MSTINITNSNRQNMFYWQVDRPFSLEEVKKIFLDRAKSFDENQAKEAIEHALIKISDNRKVLKMHPRHTAGSVNLVYRATLDDNSEVVIRIHPSEARNGYFWVEKTASDMAREIGVKTYSTLFIDDTREKFDFDFMIMTALPGENMKEASPLEKSLEISILEDLGRQLALIHCVKTDGFGFFDNQIAKATQTLKGIHAKWEDHFFAALENNLSYLKESKTFSPKQTKTIQRIFKENSPLISCASGVLVHNDIADHNMLIDKEKGIVTGILDWDECFSGDPVMDFAAWSVFYPFERMEHLKRGYMEVSALPKDFINKLHIYRLRYIVSKATIRSKKLAYEESEFNRQLLTFAFNILQDEFHWFAQK